jgi:hypothetical protein
LGADITLHARPTARAGGPGGIYTQDDYNNWRTNFGRTAGSGLGANVSAQAPEPTTFVMLIVAVACMMAARRQNASRVSKLINVLQWSKTTPFRHSLSAAVLLRPLLRNWLATLFVKTHLSVVF